MHDVGEEEYQEDVATVLDVEEDTESDDEPANYSDRKVLMALAKYDNPSLAGQSYIRERKREAAELDAKFCVKSVITPSEPGVFADLLREICKKYDLEFCEYTQMIAVDPETNRLLKAQHKPPVLEGTQKDRIEFVRTQEESTGFLADAVSSASELEHVTILDDGTVEFS